MDFKNYKFNKLGVIGAVTSLALVILDQLSKWAVMELYLRKTASFSFFEWFELGHETVANSFEEFIGVRLMPSLNLILVWNKGISFGMFGGSDLSIIFAVMSVIISLGLLCWLLVAKDKFVIISLSMIIGGAMGNVIDRLRFGAVVDFIDFYIGSYHWPAFNFADSCIVVGACIMLFITIKSDEGLINEKK